MSQFRPTDFDSDVKGALSDVVSNGVGLTFNPTAGVLSLDSADLTVFVDSDYIQARQITLDSGQVVSLIDSDYIQSRQITLDSDEVVSLIDSDYIQSRQITYDFLDSSEAIALFDSAYVQSRQLTFATEQYVDSNITVAIDDLVGGAPGALDTLNELASALGDDSDFAGTVTNQLATKLDISNFDSSFDTRLATKTTDDVGEGSNLYYTSVRVDSDITSLVDSDYVQARQLTFDFLDSSEAIELFDSAYVQARVGTLALQDADSVSITGGTIDATLLYVNDSSQLLSNDIQSAIDELDINKVDRTGDTGSIEIPSGTELQRDSSPEGGYFRFNTDTLQFEGYNGSAWGSIGGAGATGGGNDQVFIENDQVVTTSYEIGSGKNALTTGPVEIDSGVVVTVPDGSRWVIL